MSSKKPNRKVTPDEFEKQLMEMYRKAENEKIREALLVVYNYKRRINNQRIAWL